MSEETHLCVECRQPVERKSNRGKWPSRHDHCKPQGGKVKPGKRRQRRAAAANTNGAAENGALSALEVIDHFELDYNLGNATRFILERDDGKPIENLQTARMYLDRAIARLEA